MRTVKQPELWIIVASVAVLTAGHYLASTADPFWHDLFRRLYYLPILLAGFRYGLRGGLITAGAVSALFLPHVLLSIHLLHVQASEARFEIPLYLAIGAVTGILADRQRRADSALRRAERLKTLGEMAAGMAHEVKNPLAAIRSSAELMQTSSDPRCSELSGLVVSEADRLNKVVNDFLQYARPAAPRQQRQKLSRIIVSCLELLAPVIAEKRVRVERKFAPDEPDANVDPDLLRQVLLNLILNAVQVSAQGGHLEVSVSAVGRQLEASVKDSGPGMSADTLKRACEPFFTTKQGGTGLGLAIAQRIVQEHGGRLILESGPAKGTSASVVLPLA